MLSSYPGVLKGEPYVIKMRNDAKPYAAAAPKRIPLSLFEKVKTELMKVEDITIIEKVTEATEWCSPKVVASKSLS